jgi:hypothetical protein
MRGREKSVIDVGALLEKVEAAAPIDAVEVVAEELGAGRRPEGRRHDGLPGLVRGPPRGRSTTLGADLDRASAPAKDAGPG